MQSPCRLAGALSCKIGKVSQRLTTLESRIAMIETVKMRRKREVFDMVSIILSVILVNFAYRVYMKIIGADVMMFRAKTKLVWYIIVALVLFSVLGV